MRHTCEVCETPLITLEEYQTIRCGKHLTLHIYLERTKHLRAPDSRGRIGDDD